MSAASLSLEITFGDNPEDLWMGASTAWHGDGLEPEDVPAAAAQATLGLLAMRHLEDLRKEMGYANEEILRGMADDRARLHLLHLVMHSSLPPMQGMETTI